ncbi:MAG TPA: hypothetical protein VM261_06975 [Kofleriaceae bacterium]|nr:hypothetical protein [Kofleriaceae bacterium]
MTAWLSLYAVEIAARVRAGRRGTDLAHHGRMIGKDDELKDRVQARKHSMQAKLSELKADSRSSAAEARDKLTKSLDELEDTVKDGWDNVSDAVRTKLNRWLDRNP